MIQIVKKEKEANAPAFIVKVDATTIPVLPKMEYFLYIQRFGPPPTGIFDEQALDILRLELGMIRELPNYYPIGDKVYFPGPQDEDDG